MTSIIILMAGSGKRTNLGYNKMLYKIKGRPLYEIVVEKFKNLGYEDIILVVSKNDFDNVKTDVRKVVGKEERCLSVYEGLKASLGDNVMIHDGARIFISEKTINEVEKSLKTNSAVLVAHKMTDTVKVLGNKLITLDRNTLIGVETPQAGRKELLLSCYKKGIKEGFMGTDDMSFVERYSNDFIDVVYSDGKNLKITSSDDLEYASYLLERMMGK